MNSPRRATLENVITQPVTSILKSPLGPYFEIARFDHWFKNVFMIPGILLAVYANPYPLDVVFWLRILVAFIAFGMVASSNYAINEILDAPRDALHPVKKLRPVPAGRVNIKLGYVTWLALAALGFGLSFVLGWPFFLCCAGLWVMGLLYNIPPVRLKDRVYVDVLSESINNPLRLLAGWFATGVLVFPPLSLLIAYWMIGAFFMAVKRLAEYRRIANPRVAAAYRSSFKAYTEESLLISTVYYAVVFGLFYGIFIMRYRLEMIFSIPLIGGFIGYYIRLGFLPDSPTQYPERLYRETGFMLYIGVCVVVTMLLLFIDMPMMHEFFVPTIRVQ